MKDTRSKKAAVPAAGKQYESMTKTSEISLKNHGSVLKIKSKKTMIEVRNTVNDNVVLRFEIEYLCDRKPI